MCVCVCARARARILYIVLLEPLVISTLCCWLLLLFCFVLFCLFVFCFFFGGGGLGGRFSLSPPPPLSLFLITFSISMYIMCVILCLFSALIRRVGALQIVIIIIAALHNNVHTQLGPL